MVELLTGTKLSDGSHIGITPKSRYMTGWLKL